MFLNLIEPISYNPIVAYLQPHPLDWLWGGVSYRSGWPSRWPHARQVVAAVCSGCRDIPFSPMVLIHFVAVDVEISWGFSKAGLAAGTLLRGFRLPLRGV